MGIIEKGNKMYIVRTDEEINALLNECSEAEEFGKTKFRGMTYEQGIKAAIEWLTDLEVDDNPLEE